VSPVKYELGFYIPEGGIQLSSHSANAEDVTGLPCPGLEPAGPLHWGRKA
jgi:hypothetical protein